MIHNAGRGSHTPESQVKIGSSPALFASWPKVRAGRLRSSASVLRDAARQCSTPQLGVKTLGRLPSNWSISTIKIPSPPQSLFSREPMAECIAPSGVTVFNTCFPTRSAEVTPGSYGKRYRMHISLIDLVNVIIAAHDRKFHANLKICKETPARRSPVE
jgi:hypothetical protein